MNPIAVLAILLVAGCGLFESTATLTGTWTGGTDAYAAEVVWMLELNDSGRVARALR